MILYIFFIALLAFAAYCAIQISLNDFRHRLIPDKYLFPLMLTGLLLICFFPFPVSLSDAVLGATFGYVMTTIIGIIFDYKLHNKNQNTTPPIGMGDIKLIGVGGLWLGTMGLSISLIIACISGAIWAHNNKQKYIPFAPFFLLGGFLSFITITILL
jgi:prepilin signal peptidase PulO-like enzyme (type II secretory pathway)